MAPDELTVKSFGKIDDIVSVRALMLQVGVGEESVAGQVFT